MPWLSFHFFLSTLLHSFVLWQLMLMLLFRNVNRIGFFPPLFRFGFNGFWWMILSCGRCECFDRSFGITVAYCWWRWQVYLLSVLNWIMSRNVGHVFLWSWCHKNVVRHGTGSYVTLYNLKVISKRLFYTFPSSFPFKNKKRQHQEEQWLNVLPNYIDPETLTKHIGIWDKHWPVNREFNIVQGVVENNHQGQLQKKKLNNWIKSFDCHYYVI